MLQINLFVKVKLFGINQGGKSVQKIESNDIERILNRITSLNKQGYKFYRNCWNGNFFEIQFKRGKRIGVVGSAWSYPSVLSRSKPQQADIVLHKAAKTA